MIEYEIETKEQIAQRKRVFMIGVRVRRNGGKHSDNPYKTNTQDHSSWWAGFQAGA